MPYFLWRVFKNLKKGQEVEVKNYEIKDAETSPPSRYNSGSIILAMENAGKLIEDDKPEVVFEHPKNERAREFFSKILS